MKIQLGRGSYVPLSSARTELQCVNVSGAKTAFANIKSFWQRDYPDVSVAKGTLLMTVDLEDYRRQELRDHLGTPQAPSPAEVERQAHALLDLLDEINARATFFAVGRLVAELPRALWERIIKSHDIGCHGFEHLRIAHIGPARFRQDLRQAKEVLEQAAGQPVVSFRAPYFSADGCNPWYGEILAEAGMRIESSQRCWRVPRGFRGSYPLEGSGGRVTAVPLPALGLGHKRLTLIGGTYFRLLPLGAVRQLLRLAQNRGFIPTLYLHPYDIDPHAPLLHYPAGRYIKHRLSAWMRRLGRRSAAVKVHALSRDFMLNSLEGVFGAARSEHL